MSLGPLYPGRLNVRAEFAVAKADASAWAGTETFTGTITFQRNAAGSATVSDVTGSVTYSTSFSNADGTGRCTFDVPVGYAAGDQLSARLVPSVNGTAMMP